MIDEYISWFAVILTGTILVFDLYILSKLIKENIPIDIVDKLAFVTILLSFLASLSFILL